MLSASISAGIETPIRFYVTENPDGTATLSYKKPGFVFAPYLGRKGRAQDAGKRAGRCIRENRGPGFEGAMTEAMRARPPRALVSQRQKTDGLPAGGPEGEDKESEFARSRIIADHLQGAPAKKQASPGRACP